MDHAAQPGPPSRRLAVVAVGTVVATLLIAVTAWTLAPRASRASGPSGPHLSIAVVPPVEPDLIEGDMLEVGTLNDAFDRAALDRQPQVTEASSLPPDAYVGDAWSEPRTVPDPPMEQAVAAASGVAVVTSTDPLADGSRLFGFDRRPMATLAPIAADRALPQTSGTAASSSFFQ